MLQVRNRFQQFMYGRYGMDQLNRFLSTVALIVLVVSIFVRRPIVEIVALALLFWCYYRMFSRNVSKRAAENQKYLNFKYRVVCKVKKGKYGGSAGSASFAQKRAQMKYRQEQKKIYRFLHVRTVHRKYVYRREKEKSVLPVRSVRQNL